MTSPRFRQWLSSQANEKNPRLKNIGNKSRHRLLIWPTTSTNNHNMHLQRLDVATIGSYAATVARNSSTAIEIPDPNSQELAKLLTFKFNAKFFCFHALTLSSHIWLSLSHIFSRMKCKNSVVRGKNSPQLRGWEWERKTLTMLMKMVTLPQRKIMRESLLYSPICRAKSLHINVNIFLLLC